MGGSCDVWVARLAKRRLLVTLDLLAAISVASVPIAYAFGLLSLGQLFVLVTVSVVAFSYTVPFLLSLATPLRTATTTQLPSGHWQGPDRV